MHIGEFSDTFYPIVDGVGRVVYNYASIIPRKGHECYVVAPMADTGYRGGFPFELVDFSARNVPLQKQYQTGIPFFDAHYGARIAMVPLDIVHAHSPFIAGQEALRLARKRDIPLVGTFHSKYYDDFYKIVRQELLADIGVKYVVSFYEKCDEVWTVSRNSADTLRSYGYRGDIFIVPNGTPDNRPDPADLAAARERFGLAMDVPVLFYCGQLNWKKNILHILEGAQLLVRRGVPFRLVLAGQGPDERAIREKADELGLAPHMVFAGHLHEDGLLNGLYQAAALFVFPSLYDTSGMVVHEAAAMHTPSVVTRGGAPAESIVDGESGLLCDDSSESLADVIERALKAPPQWLHALGERAHEALYLPWDRVIDTALERYERLIEQKKRGRL